MEYDISATEEFGVLDLYATYEDGTVAKSSIYTYLDNNTVYVSDFSQDQAWYDCMKTKFDNNEITLDEFQAAYNGIASRYIDEYLPDGGSPDTGEIVYNVIQGVLQWETPDGEDAPLINAKVEIYKIVNGENILLNTQYTQSNGSYYFEMDMMDWDYNGEDIFVCWSLESKTFRLTNNWVIDNYLCKGSVIHDILRAKNIQINYRIPYNENSNFYRSIYIHQAMTISERFAIEMGMQVPNYSNSNKKLNVAYPSIVNKKYSGYCLGSDLVSFASIGKNEWDNIDTSTHEYGHYVQYLMDIYGSSVWEILSNWPRHSDTDDHFSDKKVKEYAMELTWSEAWASVFSTLAEQYYWYGSPQEYSYFGMDPMREPTCDSEDYEKYINTQFNQFNSDTSNLGEAQEMSVASVLWDLYDSNNLEESFDKVNLGNQLWWDYTTQAGIYTLEDFTQHFNAIRPDLRNEMGKILSHHKISPEIFDISSYDITDAPIISWAVNGSKNHPNNRFIVYFYDEYNNYLGETEMFQLDVSHRETVTYQVSDSVWNSVIENADVICAGTTINIVIGGFRYDNTWVSDEKRAYSGPYYSSYYSVIIKSNHNWMDYEFSTDLHSRKCSDCGFMESENHNFRTRMYSLEEHEVYCTDCGYSYSEAHNFNDGYDYFDTTYHLAYCECGQEARLEHNYTVNGLMDVCENCGVERNHVHSYKYQSNKDGETHEKTCDCGISQTQPCLAPVQSGTIPVCLKCNQKLKGGLIIPFSDDGEIAILPNNDEDYIEETE